MSKQFIIKPLEGIEWEHKAIALGASQSSIIEILGRPENAIGISFYYYESELRFDFDENQCVKFIEFLGGPDGQIQPQIYGVSAFETDADEFVKLLKEHNDGEIDDSENGYSYAFLNISVGIYRESIPENVREMIKEAENDGEPMTAEDIEYETKRAAHWATIGIGVKNYYS